MLNYLRTKTGIGKEMAAVLAIMGLTTLAMSLLNPILPLYLTSIDIGPALLGTMLSVAMFGMAIGEAGWGYIADRMGLRLAMITGTVISGLSVVLFVFTQSVPLIFCIFFLWGFLRSAVFGPSRGYVANAAPAKRKATFMAFSAVMLSASRSLGALPSGFLVDSFGYNSAFFTSLGVSVIGGIVVLVAFRRSTVTAIEVDTPTENDVPVSSERFNLFSLTPQCIVTALRFLGVGSTMTFLPLLATQEVGVDVALVGVLFTTGGVTDLTLAVPMGMLADRFGKKNSMTLGLLVSAGAMAGMAIADNFGLLILFVIVNSVGMVLFSPAALGLLSDSVPANRQSTAMGFYGGVCENVGILTGSALGGIIWDSFGPQPTFLMGAAASVLGAVLCLALVKTVRYKPGIPIS
ncbi:MAG: MFS transporter [Dehalococcoidales bacterium]|nr:MFS transporter [Dehalococcoidales bacterium]